MEFAKWTHTESFHNIRKKIVKDKYSYEYITVPTKYRAKIKLHGTNSGVLVKPDGQVVAQSRTRFVSPGDDNCGFAKYVAEHEEYFRICRQRANLLTRTVIFYGEWCGPGIQKGTAVSDIENKIFAIFGCQTGVDPDSKSTFLQTDPGQLKIYVGGEKVAKEHNVYIIPWYEDIPGYENAYELSFDWENKVDLAEKINLINEEIAMIEVCDPWIKKTFGVEGCGEGLVFYPYGSGLQTRKEVTEYLFKVKGEKHQATKLKTPAQMDPEKVQSIDAFIKIAVTESRLEQGLQEVGAADVKLTGQFLKWFGNDVQRECEDELEVSGLIWKDVGKQVSNVARQWFFKKAKEL